MTIAVVCFIHSFANGHMGYFQLLILLTKTAMNMLVHISWCPYKCTSIALCLEVELLGHKVGTCSALADSAKLFSKQLEAVSFCGYNKLPQI